MNPKDLAKLKAEILLKRGSYAAKRLERALDEIPGLEKMFTREALEDAFIGDNARALMTMDPAKFEDYSFQLPGDDSWVGRAGIPRGDYIKQLAGLTGFRDVPYLNIDKEERGLPLTPYIAGHEGRHRSRTLAGKGVKKSLVRLIPRAELREGFPRYGRVDQEEYIDALRKEMAMTGNKVLPQYDRPEQKRPAIDLPELYSKGGSADPKFLPVGHPQREQNLQEFMAGAHPSVLNEDGTPKVLYHGTNRVLSSFDPEKMGAQTGNPTSLLGHFFTENPQEASRYAKDFGGQTGGNVIPVHVSIKNPKRLSYETMNDLAMGAYNLLKDMPDNAWKTKEGMERIKAAHHHANQRVKDFRDSLIKEGHDGAVVRIGGNDEYIAFHPHQIKSAIGNRGTYDKREDDINKAGGGGVESDLEVAKRLGMDTSSIPEVRKAGQLREAHQTLGEKIREGAKIAAQRAKEYHESGKLPFPVGTRFTTEHTRKHKQPPIKVLGHYVDSKDPDRYGYFTEQGGEGSDDYTRTTHLVSDPKADARMAKIGKPFDRKAYWDTAQVLGGITRVKAKGGPISQDAMRLALLNRPHMARGGRLPKEEGAIQDFTPRKLQALEMTGYHGTPHLFAATEANPLGEFDASKIGTGEGAQAYGHGLYLAESPDVAKGYQSTLREQNAWNIDGQRVHGVRSRLDAQPINYAANALERFDGDKKAAIAWLKNSESPMDLEAAKLLAKSKTTQKAPGSLYHVHIPDEMVDRMLHWDKPFSEQNNSVRKALLSDKEINSRIASAIDSFGKEKVTGGNIHSMLSGKPGEIEQKLRDLGIPGIKYYDQNSRITPPVTLRELEDRLVSAKEQLPELKKYKFDTANHEKLIDSLKSQIENYSSIYPEKTHNFVIFPGEEHNLKIIKREAKGGSISKAGGGPISQDAMRLALLNRKASGGRQVTPMGFYSPAAEAAQNLSQERGTPEQMAAAISKMRGVAPEIAHAGVPKGQKVSKHELAEHFRKSVPNLQETVLSEGNALKKKWSVDSPEHEDHYDVIGPDGTVKFTGSENEANRYIEHYDNSSPKYQEYTFPGGHNYREVLMHLPPVSDEDSARLAELNRLINEKTDDYDSLTEDQRRSIRNDIKPLRDERSAIEGRKKETFKSRHWDQPNVVAHLRLLDRRDDKSNMLHMEELQSDWGQEGRDKGFKTSESDNAEKAFKDYSQKLADKYNLNPSQNLAMYGTIKKMLPEEVKTYEDLQKKWASSKDAVPSGPYVGKTEHWTDLGLKRALIEAAKNGNTHLVWTPGNEQAKRYSLKDRVSLIRYVPITESLQVYGPDDELKISKGQIKPDDLPGIIGKQLTQKLLSEKHTQINKYTGQPHMHELGDQDMEIGGEGMHKYYDKDVPERLKRIVKDLDPSVGIESFAVPLHAPFGDPFYKQMPGIRITDKMREAIKKGLPAFDHGGVVHKAGGGIIKETTMPTLAQMKAALQRGANNLQTIGAQEAPDMSPKIYIPPDQPTRQFLPPGGVSTPSGMPIGGIDMSRQAGQQLMPQNLMQPGGMGQPPQGGPQGPQGAPPAPPGGSNILSLTPQGQALSALKPSPGPQGPPQGAPQAMADGGTATLDSTPEYLSSTKSSTPPMAIMRQLVQMGQKMSGGGQPDDNASKLTKMLREKYSPPAVRASEALGQHEGKRLNVTQSDRTKVGGGFLGGPGFSALQHVDPDYAGLAWGVNSPGAASRIINATREHPEDVLWSTMIGSPTQHTSNQMVFNLMLKEFKKGIKGGKLKPELRAAINQKLASAVDKEGKPVFGNKSDIASKNFFNNLNTFDKRRVMADLMGGIAVGGKKGQIFDYDKLLKETTEPELVGAPTFAIGPRLFTVTGERSVRPDLHPAFPHMVHGEDLGQMYHPVPKEIMLPEFHEKVRKEKNRDVGYMDLTRNTPSQFLSEEFLTGLQKKGYKKGGDVSMDAMKLALTNKKAK